MKRELKLERYTLDLSEIKVLRELAETAQYVYQTVDNPLFIKNYEAYVASMPRKLWQAIVSFKKKNYDCFVVTGFPVNDQQLEKTPAHWQLPKDEYTHYLQFVHFFIAASFGYPYSWQTQNNGSMVSDILPLKGFESYQQGFGSKNELTFHTEDAFHIAKADFLSLMCLRNHTKTPTTLYPADLAQLSDDVRRELFKEQFDIVPDESHTTLTYDENDRADEETFNRFNQVKKIAILSGDFRDPYLHLDPEIIDTSNLSQEALEAYTYFCEYIKNARTPVVLNPGEVIGINNYRLAHGRGGFKAKYDGTDRWLERILTLEDLRKTIACRDSADSHVIVR